MDTKESFALRAVISDMFQSEQHGGAEKQAGIVIKKSHR